MDKKTAASILREAEARIAELATEAAKERAYEHAERLIGVARQLAATAARFDPVALLSSAPDTANLPTPTTNAVSANGDNAEDDAPIFERDRDELVKTSQSKEGKVYEHKAPRQTIDTLLRTIADKSTKRGEFRTSRIFPLFDGEGHKLPAYQGYLCLRWLRQIGLVHRIARQRYQVVDGRDPSASVESAWQSLHVRSE